MSETRWRRARCDSGACVEVGVTSWGDFLIRNSNFRNDKINFTRPEMINFIRAVKNGEFDTLFEDPS